MDGWWWGRLRAGANGHDGDDGVVEFDAKDEERHADGGNGDAVQDRSADVVAPVDDEEGRDDRRRKRDGEHEHAQLISDVDCERYAEINHENNERCEDLHEDKRNYVGARLEAERPLKGGEHEQEQDSTAPHVPPVPSHGHHSLHLGGGGHMCDPPYRGTRGCMRCAFRTRRARCG